MGKTSSQVARASSPKPEMRNPAQGASSNVCGREKRFQKPGALLGPGEESDWKGPLLRILYS